MSIVGDHGRLGVKRLRGALGNPVFSIFGYEIKCSRTSHGYATSMIEGGAMEDVSLSLFVLIEDWPDESLTVDNDSVTVDSDSVLTDTAVTKVRVTKRVTFDGVNYRIAKITTLPGNTVYRFDLASENR